MWTNDEVLCVILFSAGMAAVIIIGCIIKCCREPRQEFREDFLTYISSDIEAQIGSPLLDPVEPFETEKKLTNSPYCVIEDQTYTP